MSHTDEDLDDLPVDEEEKEDDSDEGEGKDKGEEKVVAEEEEEQLIKVEKMSLDESLLEEPTGEHVEEEEVEDKDLSYYDPDDFISEPRLSKEGTLPIDILQFDFLYGYNCRKPFNLVVLDENTLVFGSGNFIIFFDVTKRKMRFRRSYLGGGIGHIRKNSNPDYPHFAVAECGRRPVIIIYEWPTMGIICLLRGGAAKIYTNIDFSPDGELLVSQSGDPDFLITVWNWREHKILLRSKSYVHEVFRVKFSPYVAGQLTSCGLSHIKFWKMARTFTGLKLKGELGRFGKTEYSDIYGVLPMPDEKVISGCFWGNMLVWDAGLIVLEVFRTSRRTCHDAPIVQLFYDEKEGELWSVSMDGHVRIWWYEKIDQADPPDDDRIVQIDPSYDFYTPGVMLMCIEKRKPHDPDDSFHFAQDGNGGIWLIDLNTEREPEPSEQLYKCHAGEVVDMVACPFSCFIATLGKDGRIYIYDYLKKKRIMDYDFLAKGTCMIWLPMEVKPTGDILIIGFDDGQLRVCTVSVAFADEVSLHLIQVIKPHNKPITKISINPTGTILVSGSENKTIFIFLLNVDDEGGTILDPIGFFPTPEVVTCLTWHYSQEFTVLVGCMQGHMMEVEVPYERKPYTTKSFQLSLNAKYNQFKSYKSQIRRNIKLKQIEAKKARKVRKKQKEMERVKKENPGLEIDEEAFLADSESEEELEPLYYPEVPNKILWLKYTEENTIWLSMAGYDAGYIYEYLIDQVEDSPQRFTMIEDADDVEINSYVYSYKKDYLIFAMQDGSIRVNRVKKNDFRDLSDYWILPMHDNQNGFIPKMCFSCDEKFFFSCGYDGNIFAYCFYPEEGYTYPKHRLPDHCSKYSVCIRDIDTYTKLSLEEMKIKAENDRVQKLANEHKAHVREILKNLRERYARVLVRNAKLLLSQIISKEDLELDKRVTEDVDAKLADKLILVKRKLAYDVEKSELKMKKLLKYYMEPLDNGPSIVRAINRPDLYVINLKQRVITKEFWRMMEIIEQKLIQEQSKGRPPERVIPPPKVIPPKQTKTSGLEYFLLSLSPSVIKQHMDPKLDRLLHKYRNRKAKWEKRGEEWAEFQTRKPIPGKNHPDDEKLLLEAKETIGDYKMKENDDFKVPSHLRQTTVTKYKQLLETTLKFYNYRHEFIQKICDLRDKKYLIRDRLIARRNQILKIHKEIPRSLQKMGPNIPEYDPAEFPETNLKPNVILSEDIESMEDELREQIIEPSDEDQTEWELLPLQENFPKYEDGLFHSLHDQDSTKCCLESEFEALTGFSEENITVFETDLRVRRLNRKTYHQDQIINLMEIKIFNLNDEIEELKTRRLPLLVGGNMLELYLLTLNQELNILKQSEDNEERLMDKVNNNLQLVLHMEDTLDSLKNEKEELQFSIENSVLEQNKILDHFKHAADSNKFYDFLRKVFKKKYKLPKQAKPDDESSSSESSSSSSSEDVDDTASLDSRDFGIIKQDLNVCPKGCEQAIFNLTLELRDKRHRIEQIVADENKKLETVKKAIELNTKKFNVLQNQLRISRTELEIFQREKQRQLNQIQCTVVLYFKQISGFDSGKTDITELLVFSKTVLSNLYKRVTVLQHENLDQKGKLDAYHKHFSRMKKDIHYMQRRITQLKNDIVTAMQTKFGKVIDINEIEEAVIKKSFQKTNVNELEEVMLKKMVFDIRMKATDIKQLYLSELANWASKISHAQVEVSVIIKENTKKLELLRVLNQEKHDLTEVIQNQPKKKEFLKRNEQTCHQFYIDIEKLENVIKGQIKQLQELKSEIKMLKTKGLCPKAPPTVTKMPKKEKKTDDVEKWEEFNDYILNIDEVEEVMKAQITMPTFYPTESEDIVTDLLTNILQNVDVELSKNIEDMVEDILNSILKCESATEISKEIARKMSFEPSEEQEKAIEKAAEKLFAIQEVSDDSFLECAKEHLEDILDEVMLIENESTEVISKMVNKLVQSIPFDFLIEEKTLDTIVNKIEENIVTEEIDKEELKKSLKNTPSYYKREMEVIIDAILDKVFGSEQ